MVTLFPIVGRELRVASRKRITYWSRFGAALIALGAFMWVWITIGRNATSAQRGLMLFSVISGAAFIFALVAGAAITADCISEEKREGTLGLLFLTDLRGYDVVFGKLFATSIDSLYRLVSVFPILAVPVMMGGVTPQEVGRVVLVLLNTLFMSLSVGLLFSALSRDDRKARGLTIAFLLACTIGVPAATGIYAGYHNIRPNLDVMVLSPGYGFFQAFAAVHKPNHFWASLGLFHGVAWAALVISSLILPHSWQDKATSKRSERLRDRWQRWCHGDSETRKRFRDRLLDVNAVYWLAARDRIKPMHVWLFLGVGAALWLWLFTRWPEDMLETEVYITTSLLVNTVLKFWLGSEAPRLFSRDKKSGALELLLSTPMSINSILRGQMLGFWRHFGWPLAAVFTLEILMMTASLMSENFDEELLLLWFVGLTMFITDLFGLAWTGMWQGIKARNTNTASGNVLARILMLPWFLFFTLLTFWEVTDLDRAINIDEEEAMFIWLAIGLIVNAWFIYSSRRNLLAHFREIATERFQPKGWRWFGWFRKAPSS